MTPKLVLDPTLIIDQRHYLNIVKDYQINNTYNNNYIFVYYVHRKKNEMKTFVEKASKELNLKIFDFQLNNNSLVEDFLFYIKNSKSVISNSLHCTIFSIIFKKPFIAFNFNFTGSERLKSLSELLGFQERIIDINQNPNINLLNTPLKINHKTFTKMKGKSIDFIKRNLKLYKNKIF